MDQGTLVEMQIEDGQRLIDELTRNGIAVTGAFWAKEADTGEWFLYLATPLVGEGGATRTAYRRINTVIREMPREQVAISPLEVKAIGPDDPVAKAVVSLRDRYSRKVPIRLRERRLGELAVDDVLVYPAR
jgi:hypothetical protein